MIFVSYLRRSSILSISLLSPPTCHCLLFFLPYYYIDYPDFSFRVFFVLLHCLPVSMKVSRHSLFSIFRCIVSPSTFYEPASFSTQSSYSPLLVSSSLDSAASVWADLTDPLPRGRDRVWVNCDVCDEHVFYAWDRK